MAMAARMASALRLAMQAGRRSAAVGSARLAPVSNVPVAAPRWPARRAFSTESGVSITFVDPEGESTSVVAKEGQTLLDVAHENDVELEGACGGELACSTCHLVFEQSIFDSLPEVSEEEEDMLDLAWGLTDTSRLGCQIRVTKAMDGMTVHIPSDEI